MVLLTTGKCLVVRLGVMMFMEFFVWGLWYATLGLVLAHHHLNNVIADAFSVGPIAAVLSPFMLGLVVDRFVASQRALSVLHIMGACVLWFIPAQLNAGHASTVLVLLLAYMLCYMPTVALVNNVAFHALGKNRPRFPLIRVFGTVGWAVAGVAIGQGGLSDSPLLFTIAAGASLALGVFSLFLPSTPPPLAGTPFDARDLLFRDVLSLLASRNFLALAICAALISAPLAAYYAYAAPFLGTLGLRNAGTVLAMGQISELLCMLLIPLSLHHLGFKCTLLMGMLAWAARYALFALGVSPSLRSLIVLGVVLHGICYDFFFVVAFMYTDRVASAATKGQAQGLLVMLTYGIGMLAGSQLSGALYSTVSAGRSQLSVYDWQRFWWWPAGAALAVAVLFLTLFRGEEGQRGTAG